MNTWVSRTYHAFLHWCNLALHSPFGFQFVVMVCFVFFVQSFRPVYIAPGDTLFGQEQFGATTSQFPISEDGFLDNYARVKTAGFEEVLVEGEDGQQVVQILPQKRTGMLDYTVRSGDNISKIAHKFGLKVSTILWANKLTSKETLKINQEIIIPPTDGIFYTVRKNETLGEIIKTHDIDRTKVLAYNKLDDKQTIKVDQKLFLPDAQKLFVAQKPEVISRPTTSSGSSKRVFVPQSESNGLSSIGFKLLRPTKGVLTQGYIRSHYALDIANSRNTPIYASSDGVVTTSKDGWNYGYGNYVILDHGNGVETLYGHMDTRVVGIGETVKRGQLIGRMGNSGRVFGVTGIHLHFELRINGRKVNPNNYF